MSGPPQAMGAEMLTAVGAQFISRDADGMPEFVANDMHFLTRVQTLADMFGGLSRGMRHHGGVWHYEQIFINSRALFCFAELKAGTVYRYSEMHFGILPAPKFDEHQEQHVHTMMVQTPMFAIATTDPDTAKTGIIMDALAYVSHRDVTPVFFDQTLSARQLRNEESIEMLQIIRDTTIPDIGRMYGWTINLVSQLNTRIVAGDGAVASLIEAQEPTINAAIDQILNAFLR
jgi:hypothetical protein